MGKFYMRKRGIRAVSFFLTTMMILSMCFAVTAFSTSQVKAADGDVIISEINITVDPIECGTIVKVEGTESGSDYQDDDLTQTPAPSVTIETEGVLFATSAGDQDVTPASAYSALYGGEPYYVNSESADYWTLKKKDMFEGPIKNGGEDCWLKIQLCLANGYDIESVAYQPNVTVTVNGQEVQLIELSGEVYITYYKIDASMIEHDWDDGVVTQEPTATKTGIKTYTCKGCGETKTEEIAAKGSDVPQTDDHSNTVVWIVLLAVALVGGSAVLISRKLRKEQ